MLIRALIVLLLVLNLGVAAWWHWSTPAATAPGTEQPSHVARLQLVRERDGAAAAGANRGSARTPATSPVASTPVVGPGAAPVPAGPEAPTAAAATEAPAAVATVDAARCYSVGPFGSEETLVAAQATLKPLAQALAVRRPAPRTGRGWRVHLPPLANAEEATAAAGRISAAGFRDYFIVREGAEANSVALGRFATEAAARRHADALNAAGFPARAEPLGSGTGETWVDVRVADGVDPADLRAQTGAAQLRPVECAPLR